SLSLSKNKRRHSKSHQHDPFTNKRTKCHSLIEDTTVTMTKFHNLHRDTNDCTLIIIPNQQLINHIVSC
ncbi:unnamed protein product, partial [Rotaria sp. Silwood1]